MSRPLSLTPAFRGIRELLLVKGSRWPVCPKCGEEYDPAYHVLHTQQLCSGKPAARVSPDDGPRE